MDGKDILVLQTTYNLLSHLVSRRESKIRCGPTVQSQLGIAIPKRKEAEVDGRTERASIGSRTDPRGFVANGQ